MDVKLRGKVFDARNFLGGTYVEPLPDPKQEDGYGVSVVADVGKIVTGDSAQQVLRDPDLSLEVNKAGDVVFLDLSGDVGGAKVIVP